jgi:phage-related protein (TIGR01555 family)
MLQGAVRELDASAKKNGGAPTFDSFQNFAAKLGIGTDNLSTAGTYGFNPITRDHTLLEWMHRGSWIAGLAVDLIPDDMTRAGVDILGDLKAKEIEQIEEEATSLNIWGSLRDNSAWGRLYGGSIAVHMVRGQNYTTPLRVDSVSKGQYKGLIVLDRWMVQPSIEDLVTEEGPFIGQPKYYFVTAQAPGLRGVKIHYTRVIRAEGNKLPYWQTVAENMWSQSILERIYDRLVAFDSATAGAAQLVYKSWLRVYSLEGFRELVAMGGKALEGLVAAISMMARFQSIEGITLIDSKDKMEAMQHGAFAGLAEILIHLGQQISGGFQIPLVRLFGQSPVGLNSTGESDIKTYYENINNLQVRHYKMAVTLTYRLLAQSLGIKLGEGFGVNFKPLWLLEEGDKAEIAAKDGATIGKAVEDGLIKRATAMQELVKSGKITNRFLTIPDEDIAEAREEMLPEPPAPEEIEAAEINAGAKEDVAEEDRKEVAE